MGTTRAPRRWRGVAVLTVVVVAGGAAAWWWRPVPPPPPTEPPEDPPAVVRGKLVQHISELNERRAELERRVVEGDRAAKMAGTEGDHAERLAAQLARDRRELATVTKASADATEVLTEFDATVGTGEPGADVSAEVRAARVRIAQQRLLNRSRGP